MKTVWANAQAQQCAPAFNYPPGIDYGSVAVGDFNQGGIPDPAVANLAGTVSIFVGNGSRTLLASKEYGASAARSVIKH
jgi:hypothetical protein